MMRFILGLTDGFRGKIAISAVSGILRVIAGLIFVVLSKRAVDIATGNVSGNLSACIAGLVGVIAFELLCSAINGRIADLSEAKMKNSLQERLFGKLLNSEWSGKEKFHSGDSLSRLTEDCRVAAECLCRTVPTVIILIIQLICAFLFLRYFSPVLAILLLVVLPLFMIAGKVFFRKMRLLTEQIRGLEGRLQGMMQESLHHRLLLLTCRQAARIIETVSALQNSRFNLIRQRTNLTTYTKTAVISGFEAGYLIAFIWGIKGLYAKTITFGTMTAYLQLAGQIQRPLAELARLLPGLIQSHTAFRRIADIYGMKTEKMGETRISEEPGRSVGLAFKDVSFSYPDGDRIFTHFSHTFKPGSKTAIMGETGVGKSTLLLLALALIKPQEGEIDVFTRGGEENIAEPVSVATRRLFVYVPQGNSLLSGTIRDNLLLGNPKATDEEMREALHCAAADFVFGLKAGLDTICGEHGDGLSEGQAQRIAIARGLLQSGSILLLDEISASLDEETERILMERLSAKRVSHTIIMVTHRSAPLPYCDDILTL